MIENEDHERCHCQGFTIYDQIRVWNYEFGNIIQERGFFSKKPEDNFHVQACLQIPNDMDSTFPIIYIKKPENIKHGRPIFRNP